MYNNSLFVKCIRSKRFALFILAASFYFLSFSPIWDPNEICSALRQQYAVHKRAKSEVFSTSISKKTFPIVKTTTNCRTVLLHRLYKFVVTVKTSKLIAPLQLNDLLFILASFVEAIFTIFFEVFYINQLHIGKCTIQLIFITAYYFLLKNIMTAVPSKI